MSFPRFVYRTRGLYLFAALLILLWLKVRAGAGVALPAYLGLLAAVIGAQVLRTWAAGFIGTTARGSETHADVLVTAGPYAYVRNPMYLGILVIITAVAAMSGLWYALPVIWAIYAGVYATVIPYEEAFLQQQFGREYEEYYRSVPRLVPTSRAHPRPRGTFSLRAGLANELASWTVGGILSALFYVL